jgi:phage shock protein E
LVVHHDEAFLRRAAEAKARVPGLIPEDLEQQLERGAILIDVREPAEIKFGTIRNAHNIPLDVLLQEIEMAIPDRSATIVCLCAGGNRGAIAAAALLDHGYPNVQTLERGLGGVPDRLLEKG